MVNTLEPYGKWEEICGTGESGDAQYGEAAEIQLQDTSRPGNPSFALENEPVLFCACMDFESRDDCGFQKQFWRCIYVSTFHERARRNAAATLKKVPILYCGTLDNPICVTGIICPVIIMNEKVMEQLTASELLAVFPMN